MTTGGKAALYSLSGSQMGTYWTGEATFVNDNGLVVGDTTSNDDQRRERRPARWPISTARRSTSQPPTPRPG